MSSCQTANRPYLLGTSDNGTSAILYRPDCGMWSCDHCARRRKAYLAAKTYLGYEHYKSVSPKHDWYFATITSHSSLKNFAQTAWVMPKAWRKLKERIRRRHNAESDQKWRYVYVPELHEDGRLHAHLITNACITETTLKKQAGSSGFGYIADYDPINHAEHAAWYVAKYIGKQLDVVEWPPNFRRIRYTNHWPNPPSNLEDKTEDMTWKYVGDLVEPERYIEMMLCKSSLVKIDIVSQS